jgi:TonB family protein
VEKILHGLRVQGLAVSDLRPRPAYREEAGVARSMFHDLVDPSITLGHKKQYTLPLSIGVHVLIVATLILVPLLAPGALPAPASAAILAFVTLPSVASPPPPPAPPSALPRSAEAEPSLTVVRTAAPVEAPSELTSERNVTPSSELVAAVENAVGSAVGAIGLPGGFGPPPPPASKIAPPSAPVPVGGNVRAPTKVKDVRPIYPAIAQLVKVQGIVIVEATIGPTGKVQDAKVLQSQPLLESAALDAVRQWEFTPTLLNGSPVPVVMTVTVEFRLR